METLAQWIERQYAYSARAMLTSVSPVAIVKRRPGFGQNIRPVKGAIVASPVLASWDPEPDYFFHWFRDSSVVVEALRMLREAGHLGAEAIAHVEDFVRFSLSLRTLDGRRLVTAPEWRTGVMKDFAKFVREDADLNLLHGDAVVADTRVNPDGTLDISRWSRPQHDGPPLRALAMLGWAKSPGFRPRDPDAVADLIQHDLDCTFRLWRGPSYDIWEEEVGHHFYTLCVSAVALSEGAAWLESRGRAPEAQVYRAESGTVRAQLETFWLPGADHYRSRILPSGARSPKELDIAVILGAIHAAAAGDVSFVRNPRVHSTLAKLETLFDTAYAINAGRPARRAPALGRYAGDVYFSGGAYYFSTLGAAELCFRAAADSADTARWIARGDAFLETVRAFTPANGELSEQFDQRTGAQTSARHLAWSYAAFISCVTARRAVT